MMDYYDAVQMKLDADQALRDVGIAEKQIRFWQEQVKQRERTDMPARTAYAKRKLSYWQNELDRRQASLLSLQRKVVEEGW